MSDRLSLAQLHVGLLDLLTRIEVLKGRLAVREIKRRVFMIEYAALLDRLLMVQAELRRREGKR